MGQIGLIIAAIGCFMGVASAFRGKKDGSPRSAAERAMIVVLFGALGVFCLLLAFFTDATMELLGY